MIDPKATGLTKLTEKEMQVYTKRMLEYGNNGYANPIKPHQLRANKGFKIGSYNSKHNNKAK